MKKVFVFIGFVILSVLLVACKDLEIESIRMKNIPEESIIIDELKITELTFEVTYVNKTKEILNLEISMIDQENLAKLNIEGIHTIYFKYKGFLANFTLNLVENELSKKLRAIYFLSTKANATELSYEEWLASIKGSDGRQVAFQVTATHIQWQYLGDSSWMNLIALSDLVGSKGEPGINGREVIFQVTATHIQWQYLGDSSWMNLIALDTITIKPKDGLSAYEIYLKYNPNYSKSENQWLSDLLNGNLATPNYCTITFMNDNIVYLEKTILQGDTLSDIPLLEKEAYLFLGWYTGYLINDGKFTTLTTVNKNLTLYPRWEKVINSQEKSTITFDSNGGSVVEDISQNIGTAVIAPLSPTKDNLIFCGWYLDRDLTVEYIFNLMPKEDIVLYAKWRFASIEETKELISEFPLGVAVNFIGQVIGFDSMGYAHVSDETGSIYIRAKNPLLYLGNTVQISGVGFVYTGSSNYLEYTRQIKADNLIVLEHDAKINVKEPVIINDYSQITAQTDLVNEFHGNIVTIRGYVKTGSSVHTFYLVDSLGNKILQIHHYSTNFQNTYTDSSKNAFIGLDGQEVTITGIIYRFYTAENIWTIQCIGLEDELIVHDYINDELIDIHILTINDLHGYIEQNAYNQNGISNMAYLIEKIRNQNPQDDVILMGNGDMFSGTHISNVTYGRAVIEIMNMLNFDVMGIGNHEFDWGIETILAYFDGDLANGEANFPLLNANIYNGISNSLLYIENSNIFEYVVLEREGIQIGIISYIGDVYSSISFDKVKDYYFDLDIASSVKTIATSLKLNGVDVIVVNIHGGNSYQIANYNFNQSLINLTDNNNNYLVDVIINGHTHNTQQDIIRRSDDSYVSMIQAGNNGKLFGQVTLSIDLNTKKIKGIKNTLNYTSSAGTYYIEEIENYIYEVNAVIGNDNLVIAGETIYTTSDLEAWTANVMLAATGADIAVSNKGGIRSTGGITVNNPITVKQMYEINPYDNNIWLIEMSYQEVISFIYNNSLFYGLNKGVTLVPGKTYIVAVISYVYYYEQLKNIRSEADVETNLYIRDIQAYDLYLKNSLGLKFKPISDPSATIGLSFIKNNAHEFRPYLYN